MKRVLKCCVAGEALDGDKKKTSCFKAKGGGHKMQGKVLRRCSTIILREKQEETSNDGSDCSLVVYLKLEEEDLDEFVVFDSNGKEEVSCGGWMVYCPTYWENKPVTAKYPNNLSSTEDISIYHLKQELIESEFEILRKIEHNNIIKLLAYIESDNVIRPRLLIFEQLCGSSLARTIYDKNQQFKIHEICNILHDVILALEYLHNQFIVHNYINAQSIYSLETKAVIGDFQYAQDTRMEQFPITSIVSQLPWMAPAQAEGALPDVASDIYSFGALIWELLACRQPYHYTEVESNSDEEAIFVFPFEDQWNVVLRSVIALCIQKNPQARPDHKILIELICAQVYKHKIPTIELGQHVDTDGPGSREPGMDGSLKDLHVKDLKTLRKKLAIWNLTISKAQNILDHKSRKIGRHSWAKQSLIIRELEKIAYGQHLPKGRRNIAKNIIQAHQFPLRGSSYAMFEVFNSMAQNLTDNQKLTVTSSIFSEDLEYLITKVSKTGTQ